MPDVILLVDDDEIFRQSTAALLRGAGYSVETAPDYRDALKLINSDARMDLLLTDVLMPQRVNGFALARMTRMRRLDLPIVYVSGYEVPTAEALGPVLRKPVEDSELLAVIEKELAARAELSRDA